MTATATKSQLAYDALRQGLASGRFTPGYRLVLGTIAAELGISPVPVREAIRCLEAEGLVSFVPNIGAQVAPSDDQADACAVETLALAEGYATALAAPLLTADHLARARAINQEMEHSLRSFEPDAFITQNVRFHETLLEVCHNPQIVDLVRRGLDRTSHRRASLLASAAGSAHQSIKEHEQLLVSIERRAPLAEIEYAAREHCLRTRGGNLASRHRARPQRDRSPTDN
jgi:DNA-binding GntR family transcriptional regulator